MRKKRLIYTTGSSLLFRIVTILSSFIIPRMILGAYGSEVNGLVSSITQFLHVIAFLELGMGAVVQSSLYKPLAENDEITVSKIIASAGRFFKRIAAALAVYVVVLVICYPKIINQNFDFAYTAVLIVIMSINSFMQYYFGVVNRLLLSADQRGYIQYTVQTITTVLNTIACCVLIYSGCSIHVVKLTTSLIFLAQPITYKLYVDKHYKIVRNMHYDTDPIKQKWNGIAQHVSAVILGIADTIVLTVFAPLKSVSVYSVHYMVVNGVYQIINALTSGVQALLGELWAKKEKETLYKVFGWTEWLLHTVVTIVFGCTGFLVSAFVQVYTKGVTDAEYYNPIFAVILTVAIAFETLRSPYLSMIFACGHYKQTQNSFLLAAIGNVVISILLVKHLDLIGVAIGTVIAMAMHMFWLAWYTFKNCVQKSFMLLVKQLAIDAVIIVLAYMMIHGVRMHEVSYIAWIIMAVKVFLAVTLTSVVINTVFYREYVAELTRKLKK